MTIEELDDYDDNQKNGLPHGLDCERFTTGRRLRIVRLGQCHFWNTTKPVSNCGGLNNNNRRCCNSGNGTGHGK
jgi:hypothetical protein